MLSLSGRDSFRQPNEGEREDATRFDRNYHLMNALFTGAHANVKHQKYDALQSTTNNTFTLFLSLFHSSAGRWDREYANFALTAVVIWVLKTFTFGAHTQHTPISVCLLLFINCYIFLSPELFFLLRTRYCFGFSSPRLLRSRSNCIHRTITFRLSRANALDSGREVDFSFFCLDCARSQWTTG